MKESFYMGKTKLDAILVSEGAERSYINLSFCTCTENERVYRLNEEIIRKLEAYPNLTVQKIGTGGLIHLYEHGIRVYSASYV